MNPILASTKPAIGGPFYLGRSEPGRRDTLGTATFGNTKPQPT